MLVTVDLDNAKAKDVKLTLAIAKAYGLQLIRMNKSFSKKGFHLVFWIHKTQLEYLDFLDVPKELKAVVKERYYRAIAMFEDKLSILRYILGDDENRIKLDEAKEHMPEQVLFTNYIGKRVKKYEDSQNVECSD